MRYISNAFSLQMVKAGGCINVRPANWDEEFITSSQFRDKVIKNRKSIIGHTDLANILGVKVNRESITLKPGDSLLVAQVVNGRLPEGTTKLGPDVELQFYFVEVEGELTPWTSKVGNSSFFGTMLKMGKKVATLFEGGNAKAMQDSHGNFIVELSGRGFYGRMWDE